MDRINIASLNCQGLGDMSKRRDVFHYLKQKNYSIYCLQDTHFDRKLEKYVNSEWGYKSFFASYRSNARGVAVLFSNNFEFKIKNVNRDENGNFIIVHFSSIQKDFLLVNIYGPNRDDPTFYHTLKETIKTYQVNNVIAVGDWNIAMDPDIDCHNYKHINNPRARKAVETLTEELGLADVWRETNPESRRYTWRKPTPLKQSRLDFFLISDYLYWYFENADILPGYRSDHSLITLTLKFGKNEKKSNFWKFNSSLLKDADYVKEINAEIVSVVKEYAADTCDISEIGDVAQSDIKLTVSNKIFLDFMLMKIRSKTISYATMKKKKVREQEQNLIRDIESLEKIENKTENELEQLKEKNKELEVIRSKRMEGVLLRSKARWIAEGEKISKYFCNLEKRNYISKNMPKLVNNQNTIIEDQKGIEREVKTFYENLYKKRNTTDYDIDRLVRSIPKLSNEEQHSLSGKITIEEATNSLKNMKNGKSPGTDGFTVEFFKFFWKSIGHFVVRSLNEAYEDGELSTTQKEGLVICLPKGDKQKEYIRNWRPITLLNVVYKIGSSCIANRIKTVLSKLISQDQTGFMANRYIGDNIRLIYDLISYLNIKNAPGLLLSIDFEKAFDSLSWNFMFKVLKAYGFGDSISRWVETFYNSIKSSVVVNGNSTQWFNVERGCRQGDPISPYLFILSVEILSIMIKEEKSIKGIHVDDVEYKIAQFADDTQLLNEGDRTSFEQTIHILDTFGRASGLLMNSEKTQVMWLGNKKNSNEKFCPNLHMIWNPTKIKILGIWFTQDLKDCETINYKDKFAEIKVLFKIWSQRTITPLGRVAILKSLILSKLIHLWILLPDPPDQSIQLLQNLCFQFVWNGKKDKIARKTSVKTVKQGGLNIPDIRKYIYALKLSWIRKFRTSDHKWTRIAEKMYPLLKNLECYGSAILSRYFNSNRFWTDTFKAYRAFCLCITPETEGDLMAEPVFYNEKIKVGNVTIKHTKAVEKGTYNLKHFLKENGEFVSYEEFKDNLGSLIDFVTFHGWILSIKTFIKSTGITISNGNNCIQDTPRALGIIYSVSKGSKVYYEFFSQNNSEPNCCEKWTKKLNEEIPWNKIFVKIHKIQDMKLKWLQIRIVHRIIATNVVLNAMGVTNTTNCMWCNDVKDSTEHFLWNCVHAQNFWTRLEKLFNEKCRNVSVLRFTQKLIIFGMEKHIKTDTVFDFILMLAKSYVYRCKIENVFPNVSVFQTLLNSRYKIEYYNAKVQNRLQKFETEWYYYIPMFR